MNVIFLDFDGVLDTIHYRRNCDVERRIAYLAKICQKYNCKIVIEASAKNAIDEETLEPQNDWTKLILTLFNKYGIECIGRTPNVQKKYSQNSSIEMWKESEIRLYLLRHPEIEHYCVIDDDDGYPNNSDLNKVRRHLVTTINYSKNPQEEGLLPSHEILVAEALKEENEIRRLIYKRKHHQINNKSML